MAKLEAAFDVFLAHGREDERADGRQADLATVGVAGEHRVDVGEARMADDVVDVIRLVAHEDDGGRGVCRDGEIEVRVAGSGVVGAAEPEVVGATLNGHIAVDEHGRAVGAQGSDDVLGADPDIVIAEAGEALGRVEALKNLCCDAGGAPGVLVGQRAAADEVAGDKHEVRMEAVDDVDGVLEERRLGVLLEMDVADLNDMKADEGVGEIAEGEGPVGDFDLVTPVGAGIRSEGQASG